MLREHEAEGSNPSFPTNEINDLGELRLPFFYALWVTSGSFCRNGIYGVAFLLKKWTVRNARCGSQDEFIIRLVFIQGEDG